MESEQTGYSINVCKFLVGSKHAYLCGNMLVVSPAMWSLMENATPDELEHLMASIHIKRGPDLRQFGVFTTLPPVEMSLAARDVLATLRRRIASTPGASP